jgi:hypothetical protein
MKFPESGEVVIPHEYVTDEYLEEFGIEHEALLPTYGVFETEILGFGASSSLSKTSNEVPTLETDSPKFVIVTLHANFWPDACFSICGVILTKSAFCPPKAVNSFPAPEYPHSY